MSNKSEKNMLVSANVCKHPNYRPSVDLVHWYCPDCDEPFGNVMVEVTKLRSERDELVGALEEIVYQADEGMPIIDVSPCIVKASKLLAKHKPE